MGLLNILARSAKGTRRTMDRDTALAKASAVENLWILEESGRR